jgi:hypothetical protein
LSKQPIAQNSDEEDDDQIVEKAKPEHERKKSPGKHGGDPMRKSFYQLFDAMLGGKPATKPDGS